MIQVEKIDIFAGHRDCVYKLQSNEQSFFSVGGDGMLIEWDLKKPDFGKLIARTQKSIYSFKLTDEKIYLAENFEGIHEIDLKTKTVQRSLKLSSTYYFDIQIHDKTLLVCGGDGVLTIVDLETFAFLKHIKISEKSLRTCLLTEKYIFIGGTEGNIFVLSKSDYQLIKVIDGHQSSIFKIAFNPQNQHLVTCSRDAHLKIWNENFELISEIPAHLFAINDIAFNEKSKIFATCSMDKSIKIWDAKSYKLLKVIDKARHVGHGTSINSIIWFNENILIACSDDKLISIWKITL